MNRIPGLSLNHLANFSIAGGHLQLGREREKEKPASSLLIYTQTRTEITTSFSVLTGSYFGCQAACGCLFCNKHLFYLNPGFACLEKLSGLGSPEKNPHIDIPEELKV